MTTSITLAPETSLPVIVFEIGSRTIALPQNCIKRIIQTPVAIEVHSGGMGLCYWEQRSVTVIDLQHQLGYHQVPDLTTPRFMIVIQLDDLYGLLINTLPQLMELPLSSIQMLPYAYQKTDPLQLFKYSAVIQSDTGPQTIYLMDLRLFPPQVFSPESQPMLISRSAHP